MEKIVLKTDLGCSHCIRKVVPLLKGVPGIIDYSIDLEHPHKLVTIKSEGANLDAVIAGFDKAGYQAERI